MKKCLVIIPVIVAMLTLVWFFDPSESAFPYPQCPVRWLTGWECPGCGSTRALHALLHGQPIRAWHLNPWLPIALTVAAGALWGEKHGGRIGRVTHSPIFLSLFLLLSFGWMIFRNVCL